MNDPIVEEVRRIRAEIAARNSNDLRRIFEDARSREGSYGHRVGSADYRNPKSFVGKEPAAAFRDEP